MNRNITLYAQWKELYRITYHANGGEGGYDGPYMKAGGTDTVYSLDKTGITRPGYQFTGWNTKQDRDRISHEAGGRITLNGNVTLFARWEEVVKGNGRRTGSTSDDRRRVLPDDVWMPSSGGVASSNPFTGDRSNIPLCVSLLCASLATMTFCLRAGRRGKRIDAQER